MLEISIKPELLTTFLGFPITNSLFTSWLTVLLLVAAAIIVGQNYKRLPSGLQSIFEMAYESFDNMATESLGKAGAKFVPFVTAAFLFIVLSNWIGILPGVGSVVTIHDRKKAIEHGIIPLGSGENHVYEAKSAKPGEKAGEYAEGKKEEHAYVPVFRGGNADLNSTLALALIAQVLVHVSGIRSAGLRHHLAHFKNPLEIITEISKVLSFGFRLFGNVFAGEVLLAVMGMLLAILTGTLATWYGLVGGLVMVPFLVLELFVGAIQGLVFAMLVIGFLSVFVKQEGAASHH